MCFLLLGRLGRILLSFVWFATQHLPAGPSLRLPRDSDSDSDSCTLRFSSGRMHLPLQYSSCEKGSSSVQTPEPYVLR